MVDGYGRDITYLRFSVTELCNLRCRYCMPEQGVCKKRHEDMLTEDEMILAVEAAASLGITKLRITGGEPLVKKNILSICRRCARVEGIKELCLTTNATLLPQLAGPLKDAGVQRLNVSLDTLDARKYAYITRNGKLEDFWVGLEAALAAGFEKIKINTVLLGDFNREELPELAALTRQYPVDVRFIERMPMEGAESGEDFLPADRVLELLPQLRPVQADGGVARLYCLPDAMGNIGLISPVSSHFCHACNRLRLTADGKIKPCLHSDREYSLKGLDFSGMQAMLETAIGEKPAWHGGLEAGQRSHAGRFMNQIGG